MRIISSTCTIVFLLTIYSCNNQQAETQTAVETPITNLKRGEIISCGPQVNEGYGKVLFSVTVPENLKADFNTGVALLHSFEYENAEKIFAKVIDQAPNCAMAYWGVAMSNFHPLWNPPNDTELKKGLQAVRIAQSIKHKEPREADYINAIAQFYEQSDQLDHRSRVLKFEAAMQKVYEQYPDDKEAAVFYALALNAAVDPTDKSYTRQRKAGQILQSIFNEEPLHPGIAHYIIHNYDYPGLAESGLYAARKYASIAPASSHAQHMPSHIFVRLGLWDECIQSNLVSVSSAQCYAEQSKLKGHWDEELHALDYLLYAYLQKGDIAEAKKQMDYVMSIDSVYPANFKTYYAFAAIPARYYLENKMWKEAAGQKLHPAIADWKSYPWQEAIFHFSKFFGAIQIKKIDDAKQELDTMKLLYQQLTKMKNKSNEALQVMVQVKTAEAWVVFNSGDKTTALEIMTAAADMEDSMEKHPVTPGAVIPARELLAEMYLQLDQPGQALQQFEKELTISPNRFNAVYGAAIAARNSNHKEKAKKYFETLINFADPQSARKEVIAARNYLRTYSR
jgi:tetratricopeptide (TPR) repeat protein